MTTEYESAEASIEQKVCGSKLENWIKAWHRWYLGIPEKRHPIFSHLSREYERRQDQNQGRLSFLGLEESEIPKECDAKVWFLTGGYQGAISTRSFIPQGEFYILAPLYSVWASTAEYPSLNSVGQLNNFCSNEIKSVNLKNATLDGSKVSPIHFTISEPFTVGLPPGNILGLPLTKKQRKIDITLVSEGHWIWLKPLSIGDHRIQFSASTTRFVTELNLALSVAGP
jgi:hypothetical protein